MQQDLFVYFFLIYGAVWSALRNKLTVAAALTAAVVGFFVFEGGGITGIAMLIAFFAAGTWATKHKWKRKEKLLLTEGRSGKRNVIQVLANGGIAALLGAVIIFLPAYTTVCMVMIAASLASATADTLSSELGNVYGTRYYNILTSKEDKRGADGVISLEGSIAGLAGSALISIVYAMGYGFGANAFSIFIAGVAGNVADSLLGAALQRRGFISNDMVNVLNTVFAALLILLINGRS